VGGTVEEDGELGREVGGVTGSRSVMTRIVKRGGTETGVERGEGMEGEVDSGGEVEGGVPCDVDDRRGVDRTRSWKDVDNTLERAAVRLE
jgi:hypothetical protein